MTTLRADVALASGPSTPSQRPSPGFPLLAPPAGVPATVTVASLSWMTATRNPRRGLARGAGASRAEDARGRRPGHALRLPRRG
nr:unnamed protein product [Digitaria exilis]